MLPSLATAHAERKRQCRASVACCRAANVRGKGTRARRAWCFAEGVPAGRMQPRWVSRPAGEIPHDNGRQGQGESAAETQARPFEPSNVPSIAGTSPVPANTSKILDKIAAAIRIRLPAVGLETHHPPTDDGLSGGGKAQRGGDQQQTVRFTAEQIVFNSSELAVPARMSAFESSNFSRR